MLVPIFGAIIPFILGGALIVVIIILVIVKSGTPSRAKSPDADEVVNKATGPTIYKRDDPSNVGRDDPNNIEGRG